MKLYVTALQGIWISSMSERYWYCNICLFLLYFPTYLSCFDDAVILQARWWSLFEIEIELVSKKFCFFE